MVSSDREVTKTGSGRKVSGLVLTLTNRSKQETTDGVFFSTLVD